MVTQINGKEAEWPEAIRQLWESEMAKREPVYVVQANYFRPRPYRDQWDRGSRDSGFVYVVRDCEFTLGTRACRITYHGKDRAFRDSLYKVEIRRRSDNEAVQTMGPMTLAEADRVVGGASINLNHDDYVVEAVPVDLVEVDTDG